MNEAIETSGLGAGSYPEAPDLPEHEEPECFNCGWTEGLEEVDGILLCRDCREKYYLENCRDQYLAFVSGPQEIGRLALEWFLGLDEEEQGRVAAECFKQEFSFPLPQKQNQRDEIIAKYVQANAEAFAEYIESRGDAA